MHGNSRPLLDRLADKFTVGDECWEWKGGRSSNGYGAMWVEGKTVGAHRVVYETMVGVIPDGLTLDHLCRNRRCVRPDHLEPVTQRVNTLRSPIAPTALNAVKTHCSQGHEFTSENTYVYSNGRKRKCRACRRQGVTHVGDQFS